MKLFQRQNCGRPLHFENTRCERCGLSYGYLPEVETISALKPQGEPVRVSWALRSIPSCPKARAVRFPPARDGHEPFG
jgi:hypothetical protein